MTIRSFAYLGVEAREPAKWPDFAAKFVGMQPVPTESGLAFRIDEHAQRLFIEPGDEDRAMCFGWEVSDAVALAALEKRLDVAGVAVVREPASLASRRRVGGLISFSDPAGNRLEVCFEPELAGDPFQPSRGLSGFRTGTAGMGHIALTVEHMDRMLPFYRDILGFRLTDCMRDPFEAQFLHLNARHHSIGLIQTGKNSLHHLMLEYLSLDDVGHAYDLVLDEARPLGTTLGRHTNDLMTSFYTETPAGFLVELGWGGREIDPAQWTPHEITSGPSLWGHDRRWLPEPARERARKMRLHGAQVGHFEPVQVIEGNYVRKSGTCHWVDT